MKIEEAIKSNTILSIEYYSPQQIEVIRNILYSNDFETEGEYMPDERYSYVVARPDKSYTLETSRHWEGQHIPASEFLTANTPNF